MQYWQDLEIEKVNDSFSPESITLSRLRRGTSREFSLMFLVAVINEVCDFFNVGKNMNPNQVAFTAEMILDHPGFYDLTLGNIKACFRDNMMKTKLYDRLDGSIIIQWLREFKSEMADYCESVHIENSQKMKKEENAVSFAEYMELLANKISDGDEKAKEMLTIIEKQKRIPKPEDMKKKEEGFRRFKLEYLKEKNLLK